MSERRQRGSLSQQQVVDAAIEVADAGGVDALTIRAVAQRVGASPMAIYRHVDDREDLLVRMLERIASEFPVTIDAPTPFERISERFLAQHDLLAPRPWVLHILVRGDLVPPNSFAAIDATIGDLLELGFCASEAITRMGMLWHFVLGELLDRHPHLAGPRPTQRERALRAMDVGQLPNHAHVLSNLDPGDGPMNCPIRNTLPIVFAAICGDVVPTQ
jgi:AcrR family transcriptional regulator